MSMTVTVMECNLRYDGKPPDNLTEVLAAIGKYGWRPVHADSGMWVEPLYEGEGSWYDDDILVEVRTLAHLGVHGTLTVRDEWDDIDVYTLGGCSDGDVMVTVSDGVVSCAQVPKKIVYRGGTVDTDIILREVVKE